MSHSPKAAISALQSKFKVLEKTEFRGETTLVFDVQVIADIASYAKTELGFDMLLDIAGVDQFGVDPRFELVYELYSTTNGEWLRLKIRVSEDAMEVPTVSKVWPTADWHEREAYDMYGLHFTGHPDLRRILMWEGYPFFPLRKDFPLGGKPSEMPDVAFSDAAPLQGGPFVTQPGQATTKDREPRARG